jgi:hypothetical protein
MGHHVVLISIFLLLTLVVPAVIAIRVFGTAFSGFRPVSSDATAKPEEPAIEKQPDAGE